jgi:hypothetical protein
MSCSPQQVPEKQAGDTRKGEGPWAAGRYISAGLSGALSFVP